MMEGGERRVVDGGKVGVGCGLVSVKYKEVGE